MKFDFGRDLNRGSKSPRIWVGTKTPVNAYRKDIWIKGDLDNVYDEMTDIFIYTGSAWINFNPYAKHIIVKGSNETVNNSTTLQNDNELVITYPTAGDYEVTLEIYVDASNNTPDFKCDWAHTNVTALTRRHNIGPGTSITSSANAETSNFYAYPDTNQMSYGLTTTGYASIKERFIVTTQQGGTSQLRWAQNTANASDIVVIAGSSLSYQKIILE